MGSYSLEVQLFKRIPAKYRANPDKIWPAIPEIFTRATDPDPFADPWHVQLKSTSRYCSMDELKRYLSLTRPDLDLSGSWSMSGGYDLFSDIIVTTGGKSITIPAGEYNALKSDHVVSDWYVIQQAAWSMDGLYRDYDWLKPWLPCYIKKEQLQNLLDARIAHAAKPENQVFEKLDDDYDRKDVLGFLADACAAARISKCGLRAYLTD